MHLRRLGVAAAIFSLCVLPGAWVFADDIAAPAPLASSTGLAQRTDAELTAMTAQWATLSAEERRQLLAEVRSRMANNRKLPPQVGVQVERRYGRVVRKSDGSVVLQTRVVRVRPRTEGVPGARVTFGIGFEQRQKQEPEQAPAGQATSTADETSQRPVVTVSQPEGDAATE